MRTWPHAPLACALAGVAVLSCAAPSRWEKGGLVPLDVPRERTAAALAPRRIALLVGIRAFDDPAWRPLRYPGADAAALAEVLRDPERGAFDHVEVLADGPTREEVRAALRRIAERSRDERDTVLVYFSTHGTLARDGAGALRRFLVARDTRVGDVPGTALSLEEIREDFDRLRSRRKVLVLATCHSGAGKSLLPEDMQGELAGIKAGFLVRPIDEVSRASVVLAASDWGETAREDERLGNDIYTHFLVEALRIGVDRNGDGAVSVWEAHDYARRMTYEWTGGLQRPSAETTEVGADAIILAGKVSRRGRPELFSYATRLDGFTVRVDGKPVAELPGGAAVAAGRHRVQLAKGGGPDAWEGWIRVREGERVDVARLLASAPPPSLEVAGRAGGLSFLDARSRHALLRPVPVVGAAFTYADWPRHGMSLLVDAATGAGASRTQEGPRSAAFRYSAFTAGASLPWRVTAAGAASLLAGPRLSALWIDRRFAGSAAAPGQSWFTLSPGVLVGAVLPVGKRVTVGAELHLDFTVVRVDGMNRSSGLGELLLGTGYRF
ncbi:MAG TPA: caspase family protein [Anaeromyxobacter sp.]|nr:caspase family protein [Anaeromyxobacter sp.]